MDSFANPQTEEDQVAFIKKYLRNDYAKMWLVAHDLTISDVLNGRYPSSLQPKVNQMYAAWNATLKSYGMKPSFQAFDSDLFAMAIMESLKKMGVKKVEFK